MCGLPIARAVLKASAASGPDVKQVDFIFAGSHSHQATADGSIRDRMTRLGGGFCGKSMRRSIIFLWINSVHAHQMGAEDGTGVCVSVCAEGGHLYHLGCRSKKMEELHYGEICTNMLGNSVCLWSLIEIWICYRMPPVTVTFDSSIHELVHRCG